MGLEEHNITNGEDYARLLTGGIRESHAAFGGEMEEAVLNYWCEEVTKLCILRFSEYIAGDEDSYMLDEEEIRDAYKRGVDRVIEETLDKLVERGDVSMGIRQDGEIVYSTTEKGKKRLEKSEKSNKKK